MEWSNELLKCTLSLNQSGKQVSIHFYLANVANVPNNANIQLTLVDLKFPR